MIHGDSCGSASCVVVVAVRADRLLGVRLVLGRRGSRQRSSP